MATRVRGARPAAERSVAVLVVLTGAAMAILVR
jgi:hypothetical protein